MSGEPNPTAVDLVRWAFTVAPEHRAAVEAHLIDLGLDVLVRDDIHFVATWDEPDRPVEEVIEELWALTGESFEVTQEDFQRIGLSTLFQSDDQASAEAA